MLEGNMCYEKKKKLNKAKRIHSLPTLILLVNTDNTQHCQHELLAHIFTYQIRINSNILILGG